MSESVISIFRLTNARGYRAPMLQVQYDEKDSHVHWYLICGGSRGYTARFGDLNVNSPDQAADSHFMIRRVTTALLLGGAGLFQSTAVGRLTFKGLDGGVEWSAQIDQSDVTAVKASPEIEAAIRDWFTAICGSTLLRRAADDAHMALTQPHEAYVYVYRGLEWLKEGLSITWKEVAADIGCSENDIREFKKTANYNTGVRHASKTGAKLRADPEGYSLAVAALFDAICGARKRLDSNFAEPQPEKRAEAIMNAVPIVAYD
ncbi:MAG: hypothetical protein ACLQAT_20800 [Candidatus Binataceae bacterium]